MTIYTCTAIVPERVLHLMSLTIDVIENNVEKLKSSHDEFEFVHSPLISSLLVTSPHSYLF